MWYNVRIIAARERILRRTGQSMIYFRELGSRIVKGQEGMKNMLDLGRASILRELVAQREGEKWMGILRMRGEEEVDLEGAVVRLQSVRKNRKV